MKADLHSHTTASDGVQKPSVNVKLAKEAGLKAVGITDHDTVAGIEEAFRAGREIGIEVVPGIEISTSSGGQDIHMLGYYINHRDESFLEKLRELRDVRERRNEMMLDKLAELGISITMEELKARKKGEMKERNIGRPHIAEILIERGIVGSLEEAFELFLGREGKAYVNPERISPEEAVGMIIAAGGAPVLAHPGLYRQDELIPQLVRAGLKGIEVYHPDHSEEDEARYLATAERFGLIVTAGSDFHGERNGRVFHGKLGSKTVPYETVEQLREAAK